METGRVSDFATVRETEILRFLRDSPQSLVDIHEYVFSLAESRDVASPQGNETRTRVNRLESFGWIELTGSLYGLTEAGLQVLDATLANSNLNFLKGVEK